jgi:hypothetical protein
MKVLLMIERETFKDEDRRKKYYEHMDKFTPIWEKKHEGVKFKSLGGWSDQPGCVVTMAEYESMEEFSKVWSDEEFQKELLKHRNLVETMKIRIMRPTVSVR